MENIKCCEVCGCCLLIEYTKFTECIDCGSKDSVYQSENSQEYYEEKSLAQFETKDKWKEIFVTEELSKLSSFSQEKYEISVQKQKERDIRKLQNQNKPAYVPNLPKCPTCQSIKIKKISDAKRLTHAVAFGLFSKTARSQFQCLNCGYKW